MDMIWVQLHPRATVDHLGIIPEFLDDTDERAAREQLDTAYCGGWRPMEGFTLLEGSRALKYGEGEDADPPLAPLWLVAIHDEFVFVYENAWVLILKQDGTFEVSRMD